MWRNLIKNLSKQQKIAIGVVVQLVVIILLAFTLKTVLGGEEIRTYDADGNGKLEGVPDELATAFRKQLWSVVSSMDSGLGESELEYTIREGSYQRTSEGGANAAEFLVDVDAVKQTYTVSVTWSDEKGATPAEILINCPPRSEMKYPDAMCYGMYDSTDSLDVYLPYIVESPYEDAAPDIYISGDESTHTIDVEVSTCDVDGNKNKAVEYLRSTPLDLSKYTINYIINSTDVECGDE